MNTLLLALLATALLWQPILARDRSVLEADLVEHAKTERKLIFYTTIDLPQTIKVVYEFVQKYPFLDLELHPLETDELVARVQNESRTGTDTSDVTAHTGIMGF
jgi:hypothetical protein